MASRHHAQRQNRRYTPPKLHKRACTHASSRPGCSEPPPEIGNRACYPPAVRAAPPAQRVPPSAAARIRSLSPGINYATPSTVQ